MRAVRALGFIALKKVAPAVLTVWITSVVIFVAVEVLPQDPALHALGADYLGFRGALCRESRTGTLDAERVRAVCAAVQGAEDAASAATATAGAQRAAHSRSSAPPSTRLAKST